MEWIIESLTPPQGGGVTSSADWLGLRNYFVQTFMDSIISCGLPRILKSIWHYTYKVIPSGVYPPERSMYKVRAIGYEGSVMFYGMLPHEIP